MKEWPDLLARTYDVVRAPLAKLDDTHLDHPTPCTEWTMRELLAHTIGAIDGFASAAAGNAPSGAGAVEDPPQGTPVDRFDAAVARNLAAWQTLTDPDVILTLHFGEFPAVTVAGINQLDSLVHAWDIGASLGLPVALPADLADVAMRMARVRTPIGRGHVFADEVATTSTDPGERLLALTGRDPGAWPAARGVCRV